MSYLPGALKEKSTEPASETINLAHSSFLQAGTFDPSANMLTLDFKNGSQIIHQMFFGYDWQRFKEAPSHGSHYARNIKGKYSTINFKNLPKVSDLNRAIKENRPYAPTARKTRRS